MPRSKIGIKEGVSEPDPAHEKTFNTKKNGRGGTFIISWRNQTITLVDKVGGLELYNLLRDMLDEPSHMDVANIMASISSHEFYMENGWVMQNKENFVGVLHE